MENSTSVRSSNTGAADDAAVNHPSEIVEDELIEDELLVEEISIDGMCGVY